MGIEGRTVPAPCLKGKNQEKTTPTEKRRKKPNIIWKDGNLSRKQNEGGGRFTQPTIPRSDDIKGAGAFYTSCRRAARWKS